MAWTAKDLNYKSLPGLTEKQLQEHHGVLYKGYINKMNEIEEAQKSMELGTPNPTYSPFRELKVEEVFTVNAIQLHEAYFENLGGAGEISGSIKELIEADFGSVGAWHEQFIACGMSARGWVVTAFNYEDSKIHNYITDRHDFGVWSTAPLLVLDVYEHAYFIDYGTNRKAYLEAFMKDINWDEVNKRIDQSAIKDWRMAADGGGR